MALADGPIPAGELLAGIGIIAAGIYILLSGPQIIDYGAELLSKTRSLEQEYDRLLRSEEAQPKEEGSEYTWEEIQQELKELPKGKGRKRNVRIAPNRQKLREMFERWTKGGERYEPDTYKGEEGYKLDDGTWVGWREKSDSGGPAIDIQPPPGCGNQRRVHIPWP